jgi:hypothetical protein
MDRVGYIPPFDDNSLIYNRSFIFFVNKYPGFTGNSLKERQIRGHPAEVQVRAENIFRYSASISPKKDKFSPQSIDFFLIPEA